MLVFRLFFRNSQIDIKWEKLQNNIVFNANKRQNESQNQTERHENDKFETPFVFIMIFKVNILTFDFDKAFDYDVILILKILSRPSSSSLVFVNLFLHLKVNCSIVKSILESYFSHAIRCMFYAR